MKKNENLLKRKNQIINAAIKLISEEGAGSITLKVIAKNAKISPNLLLYYFPNMDSLLGVLIDHVLEELKNESVTAIEENKKNIQQSLNAYIEAPFRWAESKSDHFSVWLYFYSLCVTNKKFNELNNKIRLEGRNRIASILFEGIAKKQITLKASEVDALSWQIQSIITGGVIMHFTESKTTISESVKKTQEAVRLLMKS